jgi:predicted phage terminase large subunit-like protein
MKKNFGSMNFYTSMDLAVSKKTSGDFVVVMTIGVTSTNDWYIVKIDVGKFDPSQTIKKLFNHVRAFNPLETRAEKAALQQVLDHFIEIEMEKTNTNFYYQGLENNSSISKEFRINALQPKMKMGKIHFPRDVDVDGMAELYYEMKGYIKTGATTAHDDAVDCLANFLDPDFVTAPSGDVGTEIEGVSEDELGSDTLDDYYS